MTEERLLEIIRHEWKFHWLMNEPGYQERAFGIDSNMIHHLAKLLLPEFENDKIAHFQDALDASGELLDIFAHIIQMEVGPCNGALVLKAKDKYHKAMQRLKKIDKEKESS